MGGMNPQLSQDYSVDGRYAFGKKSIDNAAGKAFVDSYIRRRKAEREPNMQYERRTEDRFVMSGPGVNKYSFKNGFVASK